MPQPTTVVRTLCHKIKPRNQPCHHNKQLHLRNPVTHTYPSPSPKLLQPLRHTRLTPLPIDPALGPERLRVFNSPAHRNTVNHEVGPAGKKYSNARSCMRSCGGMVRTSGRQRGSSFTTTLTKGRDGMSAMQGKRRRGLPTVPASAPSALSAPPSPPDLHTTVSTHSVNLCARSGKDSRVA